MHNAMHKLSNFTGRSGWENTFGVNRSQHDLNRTSGYPQQSQAGQQRPTPTHSHSHPSAPVLAPPTQFPPVPPATPLSWCFKVPLNNALSGPDPTKVIYASQGASTRWTRQESSVGGVSDSELSPEDSLLPVHREHIDDLRRLCARLEAESKIKAIVTVGRAATLGPVPFMPISSPASVAVNVCLHGRDGDLARKVREAVLNGSPITLQSATVPVDRSIIFKGEHRQPNEDIVKWIDEIAERTKADIFLVDHAERNGNGSPKASAKEQLKFVIYGDMLTKETAKVRILIMIDRMLLNMSADTMHVDLTLHSLICGRSRKKIKAIESATDTAIYFPPTFPHVHAFQPPGAERWPADQIIITGPDTPRIFQAKQQLHDLANSAKAFVKDVRVTTSKVDHLLLERLDKIQSFMEAHASHVSLPYIGQNINAVRVYGLDVLNVERTIRDLMGLTTQFYSAEWQSQVLSRLSSEELQSMLSAICLTAGADVIFANLTFYCYGSDEACKTALNVISQNQWINISPSTIHVKLELANEHKEFVSGKKNGKINKIMNLANVQILFDGFNEYNFYIDVKGSDYAQTNMGLDLVELELPASLSFHVPDQYHKRIIGIGGQHIQTLMKKYSVFVKFSNAHDRAPVVGKEDDTVKLDNVICRTPSRNAQNLELVKQEIMDMVNRPDAEQVTEQIMIDRLSHRMLISSHMSDIDRLEKMWNCKVTFPSTEQASDVVHVSGPEFQVPNAIYGLLALVPESHEVSFTAVTEIKEYLDTADFKADVVEKLRTQHCVDVTRKTQAAEEPDPDVETLVLRYTRDITGGLKDAIDFLIGKLVVKGLDAATVKGAIPRPKSDSFEDNLPFFESRLLHRSEPSSIMGTDSPTRSQFGDATTPINERPASERGSGPGSFFSKFRKPGSMSSFSSLISRNHRSHTNGSASGGGTHSPAGSSSFFKHASSNASKASLQSMESRDSGYRNFWNDSGISLTEHSLLEEEPSALAAGGALNGHSSTPTLVRGGYFAQMGATPQLPHGVSSGNSTWPPTAPHSHAVYGLHNPLQGGHAMSGYGPASASGSGIGSSVSGSLHPFAVQSMVPGDTTPTTTAPAGMPGISSLAGGAFGRPRFDLSVPLLHQPGPRESRSGSQNTPGVMDGARPGTSNSASFQSPGPVGPFAAPFSGLKASPGPVGVAAAGRSTAPPPPGAIGGPLQPQGDVQPPAGFGNRHLSG